jgi:hypothetical protein
VLVLSRCHALIMQYHLMGYKGTMSDSESTIMRNAIIYKTTGRNSFAVQMDHWPGVVEIHCANISTKVIINLYLTFCYHVFQIAIMLKIYD